jgi:quercetin dioxygenase-like cupin family protein
MKTLNNVEIINSIVTHQKSVIRYTITPGERTPWHYHTLFTESFEVLSGTLEVGLNNEVQQLKKGDRVTIKPNEKHFFHNTSDTNCLIEVVINPGNQNFEHSLLVLKGLSQDGLANAAGTPTKLTDLALFVYLNNSNMTGFQKVAEPLFNYLAKRAIKTGRLHKLEQRYVI